MTDAELRSLLVDCLTLWATNGRVTVTASGVEIAAADGRYLVQSAPEALRPVRWFLQTPARQSAARPPRAIPSIVALLSALRNAIGAAGGNTARVGTGGLMP